jgi:ribonuclease Z
VGYAFSERKKRLKSEYVGTPGRELGRLRKEGVEIEEETFVPLFVYLGDTSTKVYEAHPEIFDYPTIITECTFLPDPHESEGDEAILQRTERDGHIHWTQLQDIVLAHPANTFVLIHFRYTCPPLQFHLTVGF